MDSTAQGQLIVRRGVTRPQPLPGIPPADYQFQNRSPSKTTVSRRGILLRTRTVPTSRAGTLPGTEQRTLATAARVAPSEPPSTVVSLYQLDQARLQIQHCAISEVALQLHDNGLWVLSLRADQNRRPAEDEPAAYNPYLYIQRNQFVVRLRCFGTFENRPSEAGLETGKPVLATLHPDPFWVENGQPRFLRTGGCDPWVEEHFEEIDRVQVEFFYYTHHPAFGPRTAE
jgi:hypothetical protein